MLDFIVFIYDELVVHITSIAENTHVRQNVYDEFNHFFLNPIHCTRSCMG